MDALDGSVAVVIPSTARTPEQIADAVVHAIREDVPLEWDV